MPETVVHRYHAEKSGTGVPPLVLEVGDPVQARVEAEVHPPPAAYCPMSATRSVRSTTPWNIVAVVG